VFNVCANETVAPVRLKDLAANLIQLIFSPGAFQDKPLININAFRDRCEFCYAHEISADAISLEISLTRYPR